MGRLQVGREQLIAEIGACVPKGLQALGPGESAVLTELTNALVDSAGESASEEFRRFQSAMERRLDVDANALSGSHRGKTILVTGATGCIGSSLLGQLTTLGPARLVSVSRGITVPRRFTDGVEYRHVDIRDRAGLLDEVARIKPDTIYHLAAQHNPSLAEKEVARTLSTNIAGSQNVFEAGRRSGAKVVHASTGKALRPFSSDIYAASKKIAEWLLIDAMSTGELVASAGRFTHVVDNSIIVERFRRWSDNGLPIRLHADDISFYLQSALEAANLLMCVGLDAVRGEMWLGAIRDLGWPVSLIDLAIGYLSTCEQRSPIYICGFEAGYEDNPYPGLYDPHISGGSSPLFNAIEAPGAIDSPHCPQVELIGAEPRRDERVNVLVERLVQAATANASPEELRTLVRECGWAILEATVESVPNIVLFRHLQLTRSIPATRFTSEDWAVVNIIRRELRRRPGALVEQMDRADEQNRTSAAVI